MAVNPLGALVDWDFWKSMQEGGTDAALALGSSMVAAPVAGLAGLYDLAPGKGSEAASARVKALRDRLTIMPEPGSVGERGLVNVGEAIEPLGEAIQYLGDKAYTASGENPYVGAGVLAATEGLTDIIPGGKARRAATTALKIKDPLADFGSKHVKEKKTAAKVRKQIREQTKAEAEVLSNARASAVSECF